jgi:seryl-tRNA synthetase
MIDTNLIKANSKDISKRLKLRNYSFDEDLFANLEAQRKKYQTETEDLQAKRNTLSKEYGLLKKRARMIQRSAKILSL